MRSASSSILQLQRAGRGSASAEAFCSRGCWPRLTTCAPIRTAVCHDVHSVHQEVEHGGQRNVHRCADRWGLVARSDLVSSYLAAKFSTNEKFHRQVEKFRIMTSKADPPSTCVVFRFTQHRSGRAAPAIRGPLAPSQASSAAKTAPWGRVPMTRLRSDAKGLAGYVAIASLCLVDTMP